MPSFLKFYVRLACVLAALSVIVLAIAAHALEGKISASRIASVTTAGQIQLFHSIAILALSGLYVHTNLKRLKTGISLMILGSLFFSFSIYLLAGRGYIFPESLGILWPITPAGGILLIASWITLALSFSKGSSDANKV